ncbi:MAG: flagellar biosynthesis protein FlhA, partial [Oscillospiraceae bacterium]
MSGSVILCLMLIPGFPKPQLIAVGGSLIALGVLLMKKPQVTPEEIATEAQTEEITSDIDYYKDINNVYGLLNVEPIEMEFGYSLIPLVDEGSGGSFIDRVVMFRKQFAMEMGIVVPSVSLKDSGQLNPNQYTIRLKGEIVAQGDVLVDHFLALAPNDASAEQIDGIDTIEPAFGIPARWISEDKKVKAELAGYTLIDPTSVIITHLSEVIRIHIYELLNRQEVQNLLENLKATNETIVSEVVPSVISLSDLQKVLSNLLRESVPIRDMQTILETLGDYGTSIRDTDILTEYTRQSLKRTISHKFSEANQLRVISVDSEIEDMIMSAIKKSEHGSYLALDPNSIQRIITATSEQIDKVKNAVQIPIILTSPITRLYLKKLLDQFFPSIVVLSYSEIETNIQIQALGSVSLNSVSQS